MLLTLSLLSSNAKVNIIRDETGFPIEFKTEGDFPRYGNDDDRADDIAVWLLKTFMNMIRKHHTYRNSEPTTSILTITSNVVYGKFTGNMPDGRPAGAPLAPGANPSYGAEQNGLLASLNSTAKLHTSMRLMVSLIHRQLAQMLLVTTMRSVSVHSWV